MWSDVIIHISKRFGELVAVFASKDDVGVLRLVEGDDDWFKVFVVFVLVYFLEVLGVSLFDVLITQEFLNCC